MHSVAQAVPAPVMTDTTTGETPRVEAAATRVAVAGATGYTGQELLRILARHPAVTIASAMSSGASSGPQRKLPALAHLWNGEIAPFSCDALAAEADVVF